MAASTDTRSDAKAADVARAAVLAAPLFLEPRTEFVLWPAASSALLRPWHDPTRSPKALDPPCHCRRLKLQSWTHLFFLIQLLLVGCG